MRRAGGVLQRRGTEEGLIIGESPCDPLGTDADMRRAARGDEAAESQGSKEERACC